MTSWISPEHIVDRLQGVKRNGKGYIAQCPVHEDRLPSLNVTEGRKGTIMHCHAGCTIDDLCMALGITKQELFYDASDSPYDETSGALAQLVASRKPAQLWGLETVGDVMWAAFVDDTLVDFEWEMAEVDAIRHHGWLWFMPYEEGVQYWTVFKAGLLFEFLRIWWKERGSPDWHTVSNAAFRRMNQVWREQRNI
jgi:hypothetical protein